MVPLQPDRVKYPLMRGALLDLFQAEKYRIGDPVAAWKTFRKILKNAVNTKKQEEKAVCAG